MFHPGWREHAFTAASGPLDLLVVGGGITGCGILLDGAQRGLRTMLVERDDLASGTSSRSSKLIHGGLRYLKEMQLGVTRQACRERDRMLLLSPHLVRPLQFVYPANRGDRTPGWQVDLGLRLYDRLTRRPDKHRRLRRREVETMVPGLDTGQLTRAFAYGDAYADDARLTVAVAATAAGYGARVATRAEVVGAVRDPGGPIRGAEVRDLETGEVRRIEATVVVNATGAWVDGLRERFGLAGQKVRPSRGSHLILDPARLPLLSAVTVPAVDDGRPVFLIPHPEGILVGTTDLYHDGPFDDPRPTADEVSYLLRTVAAHFPARHIAAADVRGTFAGVRPILLSSGDNPSEASREEAIWHEDGLLSIAGGKLTTWRAMAEEVVDAVVARLDPSRRRRIGPCLTTGTPLAGLAPLDLPERLAARGVAPALAAALAWRLADQAWAALDLAGGPGGLVPLADGTDVTAAEIRAHVRYGAVVRLDDLILRRTRLGMWQPELALRLLPAVAAVAAGELGWDTARRTLELERAAAALEGWRPAA